MTEMRPSPPGQTAAAAAAAAGDGGGTTPLPSLRRIRVTMTGLSEIGGWLPASTVNDATASAFHKIILSFAAHLGTIEGASCRVVVP